METYIHKVQYYETDRMGITHHSNYVRWMEEARVDFLEKIGWGYDKLEEQGIVSPVIKIQCEYKKSTTFNDEVSIHTDLFEYKGVRMTLEYKMILARTGEIVFWGKSEHCFLNKNGFPIRLKKEFPGFDKKLAEILKEKIGGAVNTGR